MDNKKIEQRRQYMRAYYLKNKDRYKNGYRRRSNTNRSKVKPVFAITKKHIVLHF